jgi:hypothetical protein
VNRASTSLVKTLLETLSFLIRRKAIPGFSLIPEWPLSTYSGHCRLARARLVSRTTSLGRTRVRMRKFLYALLPLLALIPARAGACTVLMPPVSEIVAEVAARGVMIRGRVIQAFDADRRLPEIIRAEEIFVGDGGPRDFVIYRSPSDFDRAIARRNSPEMAMCGLPAPYVEVGQTFERLVLMPADAAAPNAAEGTWSIHFWGNSVSMGRGLDMLRAEAERVGRFRARPPLSAQWGDCMTCVTSNRR